MGTGVERRNCGARPTDSVVGVLALSATLDVGTLRLTLRRVVSKRNGCVPVVTKFGPHTFDVTERLDGRLLAPHRLRPRCDEVADRERSDALAVVGASPTGTVHWS